MQKCNANRSGCFSPTIQKEVVGEQTLTVAKKIQIKKGGLRPTFSIF